MKKILHDTFCVIYPVVIVLVLCMGALAFSQEMNIADLAGGTAVIVGVSAGLLFLPVFTYYFISNKSKRFAVILYYGQLLILSWWISPGINWELGYGGFVVVFMIVLLGYGGAVGWALSRPAFLRMLPAAIFTLILLALYSHRALP